MLASEFFNERVRLRAQGMLPPGDPIVYDAKDTPQNRARFKAFNDYVLHYGQKLEDNPTEPNRADSSDEEDRGSCGVSNPNKQSTGIKPRRLESGDYGSVKRKLFANYTKDGKRIADASRSGVGRYEDCIDQTGASLGQYEEDSDTIVVDCEKEMEEELSARRGSNMRQPTARQIQQKLSKINPKKKSEDGKEMAKGFQLHRG